VVSLHTKRGYHFFVADFTSTNLLPFDRPARYQISVQGRVDAAWTDRLEGMEICQAMAGSDPLVTTLDGELSDQAALAGVLNTLYELHLPLLLVNRLGA
jgi:hypothetical protein